MLRPHSNKNFITVLCKRPTIYFKHSNTSSSSSSSCMLRVRRFSCSLIHKVKLVSPSLLRSSHVSSSFRSVSQRLSWHPICVHPLYVLWPLFSSYFFWFKISTAFICRLCQGKGTKKFFHFKFLGGHTYKCVEGKCCPQAGG